jgi:hypothetical protein
MTRKHRPARQPSAGTHSWAILYKHLIQRACLCMIRASTTYHTAGKNNKLSQMAAHDCKHAQDSCQEAALSDHLRCSAQAVCAVHVRFVCSTSLANSTSSSSCRYHATTLITTTPDATLCDSNKRRAVTGTRRCMHTNMYPGVDQHAHKHVRTYRLRHTCLYPSNAFLQESI